MNNCYENIVENILVEHTAFKKTSMKLAQSFDSALYSDTPISLSIIGESRTGKTTVVEHFYADHMPYRVPEGRRVPILKVVAPSEPTIIGLAEHMLCHMGDERFYHGTKIAKTIRLKKLIAAAETKMVIIDEFQHFIDKGTDRVIHSAADWLKTLVEECNVSLVILGLESALSVFDQNEQLRGRFSAPIEMPRFDWRKKVHRQEFLAIVSAFESQISHRFNCIELSNNDVGFRLYIASGGLIGYLWKLLRQVTLNADYSNNSKISLCALDEAYEESIGVRFGPSPFRDDANLKKTKSVIEAAMSKGRHVQTKTESKRRSKRKKAEPLSSILSVS